VRVLADFRIDSDLCLPAGDPPLRIRADRHGFEATLSNVSAGDGDPAAVLACRILFDAPTLQEARDPAFAVVVLAMGALAYATNRRFGRPKLLRLVECGGDPVLRGAIVYHESPADDRTEPGLAPEFGVTVEHLLSRAGDERLHSALRWFRLGIQSDVLEEQFSYFWFALEIAAQKLKSVEKKHSECPHCHGKLYCEACGKYPMHRPYPREAIEHVVTMVHPQGAAEIFAALQKIRHAFMHGERIDSVAHELPCSPEQAIDKLAFIAWQALSKLFDVAQEIEPRTLVFGRPDSFVRRTLSMGVHIQTTIPDRSDEPGVPDVDRFPDFKISVEYGPRPAPSAPTDDDAD
jgi:hypothetical protein